MLLPALAFSLFSQPLAASASPAGTVISNVAYASFLVNGAPFKKASNINTIVMAAPRTKSEVSFQQYAPGVPGATDENVPATYGKASGLAGPFSALPAPTPAGGGAAIDLGSPVPLLPASIFHAGEPVFIMVADGDQNLDPLVPDTVKVTVRCGNDLEVLVLTETGPATGIFRGCLQTAEGSAALAGDGVLSVTENCQVSVTYVDAVDGGDSSAAAVMVDPFGAVFDSATGKPVNGATVTLLNADTNLPAAVYGEDGISSFPASVLSGSSATDSAGRAYRFPDGGFRFPFLLPGRYRLVVTPPSGYEAPSKVPTASLQALPGAPFSILAPGSRGEVFAVLPGPAFRLDYPVDPKADGLFLTKKAGRDLVAAGDFLAYTLRLENSGVAVIPSVSLSDRLPLGFRYRAGSLRVNGRKASDPVFQKDGRSFSAPLGDMAPGEVVDISYVAEVSAGTRAGMAENLARAAGSNAASNIARAAVMVKEEFFRDAAFIAGRVASGCPSGDGAAPRDGIPNVRLYLEDGRFSVTDKRGLYHFEGIAPGVHVVQVDESSLPPGWEASPCVENTRTAGRAFSRFVDVAPGMLARADFFARKKPEPAGEVRVILSGKRGSETAGYSLCVVGKNASVRNLALMVVLPEGSRYVPREGMEEPAATGSILTWRKGAFSGDWTQSVSFYAAVPPEGSFTLKALAVFDAAGETEKRNVPVTLLLAKPGDEGSENAAVAVKVPAADSAAGPSGAKEHEGEPVFDAAWLSGAEPGLAMLLPAAGYLPPIPSLKVAVKHGKAASVSLFVNGEEVNRANFEGSLKNADETVFLSRWSGVALVEGDNLVSVRLKDAAGNEIGRVERSIHYSGPPVAAELLPARSVLTADGRTPLSLAFRLTDKDGFPARNGVVGTFSVDAPYRSYEEVKTTAQDPLSGQVEKKSVYTVGEGGVALLKLAETGTPGEAVLRFPFASGDHEYRVWISPESRDWILVGLAEGAAGYNTVSGHVENFAASGGEDDFYKDGRLAFFAKGRIKGSWLLTLGYDSARKGEADPNAVLGGAVDPNQYYTVYGDASVSGQAAASREKLYVRVERDRFYLLFGDLDTGLTVTELSRYSRKVTGLQARYAGERLDVSAFAARTADGKKRDEIRGDGTSGLYRLSRKEIVAGSESVVIETRDRLRSEKIVAREQLTRNIDYSIDYEAGTIFFKRPVYSKDEDWNPVFIVVDYETSGTARDTDYGGRAALRFLDKRLEVGATGIHEGNAGEGGNLGGADATLAITPRTKVHAEAAASRTGEGSAVESGSAYAAELTHEGERLKAEAYARETGEGFGLAQQNASEIGARKVGADASYKVGGAFSLDGETYRQTNLATGADRDVAETKLRWARARTTLSAGYRFARDSFEDGTAVSARQVLAGGSVNLLGERLRLRLTREQSLDGESDSADFPTRTVLGVDYRILSKVTLFAEEEFAESSVKDTQATRVGIKTTPWAGGRVDTALERDYQENSDRLFAVLGLGQSFQPFAGWKFDLGLDQGRTVSGRTPSAAPAVTTADTGAESDFTAVSVGAARNGGAWSATSRVEYRTSDTEDKWGVTAGLYGEPRPGLGLSAGVQYFDVAGKDGSGSSSNQRTDLRLGLAWRPERGRVIVLDRLDLLLDDGACTEGEESRRVVNNLNVNIAPDERTEVSVKYGAKYVLVDFSGDAYSGFTDFWGLEIRRDISPRFDVGFSGGVLHGWDAGLFEYTAGPSVGVTLAENIWVSVGYNVVGFSDRDFDAAGFTGAGPFIRCRIKFDQQTAKELVKDFGGL